MGKEMRWMIYGLGNDLVNIWDCKLLEYIIIQRVVGCMEGKITAKRQRNVMRRCFLARMRYTLEINILCAYSHLIGPKGTNEF